jgi:2-polyprenyl-3-methyl-5-hydroxy-6-metoxy-1,4-benzoquinol methylase
MPSPPSQTTGRRMQQTNSPLPYPKFVARCRQSVKLNDRQGEEFLTYHTVRFHCTYRLCYGLLQRGGSLLSVGTGSAYVEAVLASELQARVIAVDFPAAIELHRRLYGANNFTSVAVDLSLDELQLPIEPCDMVLSTEILEHIPEAPARHFRKLLPYLKPNGYLVVTTPNLGSLEQILSLWRMLPIMDPPERTFAPVSFENEGTHRREYMPCEIIDSMTECGLEHLATHFIWYHRESHAPRRWLERLIPHLRPAMIILARKR